ncbi:MAG: hypothetical protein M3Q68_06365, partial [Actinomycetota bacterium]|nr:hypothetical protein [Actinomycetota bacterium]
MRIRRVFLTTAVIALGLSLAPSSPAAAFEGEPIVLRAEEGTSFSADYGPMPVPDSGGALTHPGDCALSASCTEIPLTVELPDDYDPDEDEFFFNFLAEWEGNVDLVAAGSQDLDIFIYTLRPNEETGEEEYVVAGQAATASQPERTRLFNFNEGEYVICVVNFLGVNTGFRLTFDYVDVSLPDDFDPFDGANSGRGSSSSSGSADSGETGGSGESGGSGGGAPTLSPSFTSPSRSGDLNLEPTAPAPSSPSTLAGAVDAFGFGLAATPGDAGIGDFGSFSQFQKDLNAEA